MKDFYEYIESERIRMGLSKQELVDRGITSRNWLCESRHQNGENVRLTKADKMCAMLGIKYTIGLRKESDQPITRMSFGDFVEKILLESDKTCKELSKVSGIPYWTISKIPSGQRSPYLSTADRICKTLLVSYTIGGGYNV